MADETMLADVARKDEARTRWFCSNGAVRLRDDGVYEVTAGGYLIGTYTRREPERRNLLLIALADNPAVELGALARAFGITPERLRQIRKLASEQGVDALMVRHRLGRKPLSAHMKKKISALFDDGLSIDQAYSKVKRSVSRASVGRVHKEWAAKREHRAAEQSAMQQEPQQQTLFSDQPDDVVVMVREESADRRDRSDLRSSVIVAGPTRSLMHLEDALERGGSYVQHVGSWIMLAALHASGLYADAERFRSDDVDPEQLRIAIDATATTLAIGQRCVEGVRRLATPSMTTLLRSRGKPSASWTRVRLHEFAKNAAVLLHLSAARRHARVLARNKPERLTFYIDNHLRPYTGKHVIRKGWRMQDKRVVPGCTDYYVHDAAGRPVMRLDRPMHEPLVDAVQPIGRFLQKHVGSDVPLLFVFDRAGAFPEHLAALRDASFEFVTYERKPYPLLPASAFKHTLRYGREVIRWCERPQKNLRCGRGRVRRISLLMTDGAQINLLAVSTAAAPELILALLHRWARQENQFKHGNERWGINQLDGRRVEPYPEDSVIPNPARRRLELDLRDARFDEAEALRELAHLPREHRRRERLEQVASDAYARQCELEARRAHVPKRAPLRETELTRRLRLHPGRYKLVVDTIRNALANIETNLATELAPHLTKPREAKKTLATLLTAPGQVRVTTDSIRVVLRPAGTRREYRAFAALLRRINARRLTLPGDAAARRLRFRIANS